MLAAAALCVAIAPHTHAADSVQYWPTYRDASANVYTYNPWQQFELNMQVGYITDIQFRHDEDILSIAAGNSDEFKFSQQTIDGKPHIFVKPVVKSGRTNLVVSTTKRAYRFLLNATNEHEYVVVFIYPEADKKEAIEQQEAQMRAEAREQQLFLRLASTSFNSDYMVKKNKNVKNEYLPERIFDDGTKTYIQLSRNNKDNFPTVYYFDEYKKNKLQLVNYRLKDDYLEIDKIADGFKIVFSQDAYLIVEKTHKKGAVTPAKDIQFKPVDVNQLTDVLYGQDGSTLEVQTSYMSLKDRMKQHAVEQAQALLEKQTAPTENPMMEAIDDKINQLQAEIGLGQDKSDGLDLKKEEDELNRVRQEIEQINQQ